MTRQVLPVRYLNTRPASGMPRVTFDPRGKEARLGPRVGFGGRVQLEVIDSKSKKPVEFSYGQQRVKKTPWIHNLILNYWLDNFPDGNWLSGDVQFLAFAHVGTGSSANKTDSGTVTASQSGTTITLSGTLAAVGVGKVIKWDSGEYSVITAGSGTSWTAARSQTVIAGEFNVHHTEETTLNTWTKANSSVLSTTDNAVLIDGTKEIVRVYDFAAEGANINYNEVGIGPYNTNLNLWSRIVLPASVTVLAGQQVRVTYSLTFTFGPLTDTTSSLLIDGWALGTVIERCVGLQNCLNASENDNRTGALHPRGRASGGDVFSDMGVFTTSSLPALTAGSAGMSYVNIVSAIGVGVSTGSFLRNKTATFSVALGNSSALRGIGLTLGPGDIGFGCLFTNAVEKLNTHTLTVTARIQMDPEYV